MNLSRMGGFLAGLVWGTLCILLGSFIIVWVLYNYLVERQPEFSGPRFFCGFGIGVPMVTVGICRLRELRRNIAR